MDDSSFKTFIVSIPKLASRLEVGQGGVVCIEAITRGDVKIGKTTIVHPHARILATGGGSIVIGDSNIIEEFALIENKSPHPMIIGSHNVFEVRSIISARSIGDHNSFGISCIVGENIEIGNGNSIGAKTQLLGPYDGKFPDNSVFYGNPMKHGIANDYPQSQLLQIDFLSRVLPNYHNILNPKKQPTV